jgi:hypothetical protein
MFRATSAKAAVTDKVRLYEVPSLIFHPAVEQLVLNRVSKAQPSQPNIRCVLRTTGASSAEMDQMLGSMNLAETE